MTDKNIPTASYRQEKVELLFSSVTKEEKEYSLDIDPYSGEVDEVLKHFARFQLNGDIPNKIKDIDVVLLHGVNNYEIKLENGCLLLRKTERKRNIHGIIWSTIELINRTITSI